MGGTAQIHDINVEVEGFEDFDASSDNSLLGSGIELAGQERNQESAVYS